MHPKLQKVFDTIEKEGDREVFIYKGYKCVIQRGLLFGNLCAYVGLPEGHRLYGKHYDDIKDLKCHGGLTYSNNGIDTDDLWYLGFDAGHVGDLCPETYKRKEEQRNNTVPHKFYLNGKEYDYERLDSDDDFLLQHEEYRNMKYMKAECRRLVDQII